MDRTYGRERGTHGVYSPQGTWRVPLRVRERLRKCEFASLPIIERKTPATSHAILLVSRRPLGRREATLGVVSRANLRVFLKLWEYKAHVLAHLERGTNPHNRG